MFRFIVLASIALVLFCSSCARCVKCSKGSSSETLCESEYSSTTAYEAEVNNRRSQGYACVDE
ncbi:MAG: hypothetical protein RMJ53_10375 [Chitinophagales bacterium]|nr:hypothetical protein [Chitinophagales bacterium]